MEKNFVEFPEKEPYSREDFRRRSLLSTKSSLLERNPRDKFEEKRKKVDYNNTALS